MPIAEYLAINEGRPGSKRRKRRSNSVGARVKRAAKKRARRMRRGPGGQFLSKKRARRNPKSARRKRGYRSAARKAMAKSRRRRTPPRNAKGRFLKRGRRAASGTARRARRRARRNPSNPVSNPSHKKRARRVGSKARRRRARRNPDELHQPTRSTMTKHQKRVAAGKKAARTRKRRESEKKRGRKRRGGGRKRRSSSRRRAAPRRRRAARGKRWKHYTRKIKRISGRTPWSRARRSALVAKRAASVPGVSARARSYLKRHGLSKVNPSWSEGVGAFVNSVGEIIVGTVGFVGIGMIGAKVGAKLVEKWGAGWAPVAAPAVSLVASFLAFLGLRMSPKLASYSVPVALGGTISAVVNLLASVHGAAPAGGGPALSLGRQLGLPIGDALLPGLDTGMNLHGVGMMVPRSELAGIYPRSEVSAFVPRSEIAGYLGDGGSALTEEEKIERLIGEIAVAEGSAQNAF